MQGLSEGKIVHYVAYDNKHLLAVVIKFDREKQSEKPVRLDLAIFTGTNKPRVGMKPWVRDVFVDPLFGIWTYVIGLARLVANDELQFHTQIPFNSDKIPGTWHWVERT
jgi:hypothetical protein